MKPSSVSHFPKPAVPREKQNQYTAWFDHLLNFQSLIRGVLSGVISSWKTNRGWPKLFNLALPFPELPGEGTLDSFTSADGKLQSKFIFLGRREILVYGSHRSFLADLPGSTWIITKQTVDLCPEAAPYHITAAIHAFSALHFQCLFYYVLPFFLLPTVIMSVFKCPATPTTSYILAPGFSVTSGFNGIACGRRHSCPYRWDYYIIWYSGLAISSHWLSTATGL